METIGNIFNRSPKKSVFWRQVNTALLLEKANNLLFTYFGEQGQKSARALYCRNKILVIACLNSIIAQEIRLRENQLLKAINEMYAERAVEKIKYLS